MEMARDWKSSSPTLTFTRASEMIKTDLIIGSIRELGRDRDAAWYAYFVIDKELEKCRAELRRTVAELNRLKCLIKKNRGSCDHLEKKRDAKIRKS